MIYLTEKYSKFFEKKGFLSYFKLIGLTPSFISDIIKSGKLVELKSFVIWEIMYYLGSFPKKSFLKFNKNYHIDSTNNFSLEKEKLDNIIDNFNLNSDILKIEILEKALCVSFFDYYRKIYYGAEFNNNTFLLISNDGISFNSLNKFEEEIHALYVAKDGTTIVNSGNKIYRKNLNEQFELVLELSSTNSFLRHNGCFSEDNFGNLYIAEYGLNWDKNSNWLSLAYLYISKDNGKNWERIDFFKKMGANKHLHLVFYDDLHNCIIVTDGDNYKRLWINFTMKEMNKFANNPNEDGWYLYNKTHFQKGGHISSANFLNKTVFGSDYLGGQNFLLTSDNLLNYSIFVVPEPYRRNPINSLIKMQLGDKLILWASIHTMQNFGKSRGLIMFTENLDRWDKVFEYNGTKYLTSMISTTNNITNDIYLLIRQSEDSKNESITLRISAK